MASPAGSPGHEHTLTDVGRLQRSAGNNTIFRLRQRRAADVTPAVTPGLESYLSTSRSGGQPLPAASRAYFEPRFGRNLSDVRLHADSRAASAAAEVGARAFTTGSDVYFGAGQLQPGTSQSDRLLAHELTHVAQQQPGAAIQRQPTSTTAGTPTPAIYRESVQDAISFFNTGASFYGRRSVAMTRAIFDRVMNGWYGMVVRQESIIDTQLGRDAALKRDLRAAYTAAIRVVMTKAATALGKTEDDLYRENNGRIPLWAWQTPHYMVRGMSTPIAEGRTVNRAGNVVFASNGFNITMRPNAIRRTQSKPGVAEIDMVFRAPGRTFDAQGIAHVGAVPTPTATIRIFYRSAAAASGQSAYGRGTTAEDIAGGAVTPRSTTVGFHEGAHGLAFVEFLEKNPPPQFTGTATQTDAQFVAAQNSYLAAGAAYRNRLLAFSTLHVHCVGTTVDQFNLANAQVGANIVLECGP